MEIPAYTIIDEGTDLLWAQFQQIVKELNWTTDDNTILDLLPNHSTTRCVFAEKNEDGTFLGCVVWNEFDGMGYIGFYIVVPSLRKCGLGSILWARALDQIRKAGLIISLRSVPDMVSRYAANDTPVEISRMRKVYLPVSEMKEFCGKYPGASGTIKTTSQLTAQEKEDLLRFDREVTGKDRSALLVRFLAHPLMEGAVLLNEEGQIVAWAGITTTGFEKDNLFKLAPVYASSLAEFSKLTLALIPFCERSSVDARILVQILTGTVSESELETAIESTMNSSELNADTEFALTLVQHVCENVVEDLNWVRQKASHVYVRMDQNFFYASLVADQYATVLGFSIFAMLRQLIIEVKRGSRKASDATRRYQQLAVRSLILQGAVPGLVYLIPSFINMVFF
ncbi:hypothetical protein PRIPAC_81328, partial [Pristionchus pacificus]|uniref:G protein-coupled receptor n=1 Tax=Pristionchus pacificus TaxID=54126 RepID=A0A2A6CJ95_PRIPA